MRFKSARLRNFKRFTDLTVERIPETTQLIVLYGPNGCGKSSFLDALKVWHDPDSETEFELEKEYYFKSSSYKPQDNSGSIDINFYDSFTREEKKSQILRIRPSYRNDPNFRVRRLEDFSRLYRSETISRMTDNDTSVSMNYQKLVGIAFEDLFASGNKTMTVSEFNANVLGEIRRYVKDLFPDIHLNDLGNPLSDGTFRFTKGISQNIPFDSLSGGEKAAFDLILDIVVSKRYHKNTVFCIDEPEAHMHTRLQAELLSALLQIVPKQCQLMLATFSLGMMRRAMEISKKHPGTVSLLDFGDRDFDKPQVIRPVVPGRAFWKRAYDVALDDLATLLAPERVIICEGRWRTSTPVRNHSQDARCYECIFESEFSETRFVSMGNDQQVSNDWHGLAQTLLTLIDGLEVVRLIDRDDRSEAEVAELLRQGVRVLSRRNLESYLFDDEVLRALAKSVGKKRKETALIAEKQRILASTRDVSPDNLKPASGQIYNACKNILSLTQCGNNTEAFMRDTLAPLIRSDMKIYKELKHDIFGARLP